VARAADGTNVVPATPAVPAIPAAPAVPAPAVPSVPAVPSTPALPAAPSAPIASVKATTPAGRVVVHTAKSVAHVANPVASVKATVAKPAVRITTPAAKLAVTPAAGGLHAVAPAKPALATPSLAIQSNTQVTRIHQGIIIKLQPASVVFKKKATGWRKLMWNAGDDDWNSGCFMGPYTTCTKAPVGPISNRCSVCDNGTMSGKVRINTTTGVVEGTMSPGSTDEVMFSQGFETTWTRVEQIYKKNSLGVSVPVGTKVHFKQFIRGLQGVGVPSETIYRSGKDIQDQWTVFIPAQVDPNNPTEPPFAVDKRTWDELIVAKPNVPQALPSMWYSEHFVVRADQIKITWRITCKKGQKADDDPDEGHDHDRNGDYDKYRHNTQDYHGYNNDDPSSWDQND
jgi:hypothetical protein